MPPAGTGALGSRRFMQAISIKQEACNDAVAVRTVADVAD